MEKNTPNEKPTPLQKIILQQIARYLDEDGYCRITNAELGKISSGITRKRCQIEIGHLVENGYLERELIKVPGKTNRKLRLTSKVQELMI